MRRGSGGLEPKSCGSRGLQEGRGADLARSFQRSLSTCDSLDEPLVGKGSVRIAPLGRIGGCHLARGTERTVESEALVGGALIGSTPKLPAHRRPRWVLFGASLRRRAAGLPEHLAQKLLWGSPLQGLLSPDDSSTQSASRTGSAGHTWALRDAPSRSSVANPSQTTPSRHASEVGRRRRNPKSAECP